jgi:hypothetical protein
MRLARNPDMDRYFSHNPLLRCEMPPIFINLTPLREAMIDVRDKFPGYDLLSEEGVAEANRDIEATLRPVASFREMEPWMGSHEFHEADRLYEASKK